MLSNMGIKESPVTGCRNSLRPRSQRCDISSLADPSLVVAFNDAYPIQVKIDKLYADVLIRLTVMAWI